MRNTKTHILVLFVLIIPILNYLLKDIIDFSYPISKQSLFDIAVLLVSGFFGLVLANKLNLFIYYPSKEFIKNSLKTIFFILFLGLLLIAANEISWILYSKNGVSPAWIEKLNFNTAILISIRAAIYEEILFRLFLITVIIYYLKNIISYRKSAFISVLISAFIFSVSFHSGSIISFASGLLLGFVYLSTGIIPSILLHFMADAVPFITLSYLLAK